MSDEGWDPATISAVAALVIAVVAIFIAMAQALQQYFITGQLIRLCDSVVFGPMPGKGHRIWQASQFRFRVVYSIPQISLQTDLWPDGGGTITKSYNTGRHSLPRLADPNNQPGSDSELDSDSYKSSASSESSLSRWRTTRRRRGFVVKKPETWKSRFTSRLRRFPWITSSGPDIEKTESSVDDPTSFVEKRSRFLPSFLPLWRRRQQHSSRSSTSISESSSSRSDVDSEINRARATSKMAQRREDLWRRISARMRQREPEDAVTEEVYRPPQRRKPVASRPSLPGVGEASWVSFCRAIEFPCGSSVRIDLVKYDADRCPGDLVCAPMQVSMREVVLMALMAGMDLTSASFAEKSVSMQGAVGTLTSSNHPVLGPILHFTPRNLKASVPMALGAGGLGVRGTVDQRWMARTWNVCSVAKQYYNSTKRRTTRRLDDRWIRDNKGVKGYEIHRPDEFRKGAAGKKGSNGATKGKGKGKDRETVEPPTVVVRQGNAVQVPRSQDGHWTIDLPVEELSRHMLDEMAARKAARHAARLASEAETNAAFIHHPLPPPPPPPMMFPRPARQATVEAVPDEGEQDSQSPAAASGVDMGHLPPPLPRTTGRRTTVEDTSDVEIIVVKSSDDQSTHEPPSGPSVERVKTAKDLQAARTERLLKIQQDRELVEESVKRQAMSSPYEEAATAVDATRNTRSLPLLLTNYAHNQPSASTEDAQPKPTTEEEEAASRERMREQQRLQRDEERVERNRARHQAVGLLGVNMFWLSQVDIFAGRWATPWHDPELIPIDTALDGAVTVVLEALLGFLDVGTSLLYTGSRFLTSFSFEKTAEWMFRGAGGRHHSTYPAYAQNGRGGLIAEGRYTGVRIPAIKGCVIPALELLHSYEWQVDSMRHDREMVEEKNVELIRLDAWLSYVGRTEEISGGPHRLLRQTPALVQLLMEEFELDFQNIDLSAEEGGLQDIQGLAANVMDFLTDEELTDAEQLYVLVALLRTVKVAQCVRAGSDTTDLRKILERDVQVYLV
ncbi:hypothetical protein B0T17DRAFT_532085 [Bombardia bombarda]|uniref:Uncharacterized protein n=1 Tax=Bombardia bombarda TaxID=252184 RepID=A0AA39X1B1_9PEZI|nr:hypothetical protein B0T17DRAFT_532085 [Bombardia bombarda]